MSIPVPYAPGMNMTRVGNGAESVVLLVALVGGALACKPKPAGPPPVQLGDTVAKLVANPKSIAPLTSKDEKGVARYTYPDQAAGAATRLELTTTKERAGAWRVSLLSPGTLTPYSFAPELGVIGTDEADWSEIVEGPLKGNVVNLREGGHAAAVMSPAFVLTKEATGAEGVRAWACGTGRAGVTGMKRGDFTGQCEDMIRVKLLVPNSGEFHSVGIDHEVLVAANCDMIWSSSVKAKNAFGTMIPHAFTCNYTAKTSMLNADLR